MLSRREFIPLTAMGAAAARQAAQPIEIISQQQEFYHGWPTLARRTNGGLIVAYSGGRETHVCPFGRIEIIRSSDDGKTWSWPEVILDTAIDDRDAGVLETPSGTLLVTTFTSLAYEPVLERAKDWPAARLARWQAVDRRTGARRCSANPRMAAELGPRHTRLVCGGCLPIFCGCATATF
jgi:sialidase-1